MTAKILTVSMTPFDSHLQSPSPMGVQLFNNKVLRSRSLRECPTKFPMSIVLYIGAPRRGGVEGRCPLTWKISGQTLFSGQTQVAQKSRMQQNISVQWKILGQLFFRASASYSKILNGEKTISQLYRTDLQEVSGPLRFRLKKLVSGQIVYF